jgi:glycosyltransferase involved in cell wall biosynthesis
VIGGAPRILYIQYTNPAVYPPLEHSSRILADAGWQVLFLGMQAMAADQLQFVSDPSIRVLLLPFRTPGLRQKAQYIWFCLWTCAWVARWKPSAVYASDLFACLPAILISMLFRVPVLYHEHDSPEVASPGLFLRLCLTARRACARRALCSILPNEERARRFSEETKPTAPVKVVWNCPARAEALPVPREPTSGGLRLLFQGSIVPERLPLTIVEALAELPASVVLTVVGYETIGSQGYLGKLRDRAKELRLSERLQILGVLPRRAMLEAGRTADVGLSLLPLTTEDFNAMTLTGASNKPFEYLANGLPLLVSNLPDWQRMFVEQGYGLACDPGDPASIAASIRWFLDNPKERRTQGEKGRQRIVSEWNYETVFQPVAETLRMLVLSLATRESAI